MRNCRVGNCRVGNCHGGKLSEWETVRAPTGGRWPRCAVASPAVGIVSNVVGVGVSIVGVVGVGVRERR